MKTLLRPFACSWRLVLALVLLMLQLSWAQQAPRQPTRPVHSSRSGLVKSTKSKVSSAQVDPRNTSARTTTTELRQDALFSNPSFEPGRYARLDLVVTLLPVGIPTAHRVVIYCQIPLEYLMAGGVTSRQRMETLILGSPLGMVSMLVSPSAYAIHSKRA